MNRVVATKAKLDGEQAGALHQTAVHTDQRSLREKLCQVGQRKLQITVADPAGTACSCKGRLTFGYREDARRDRGCRRLPDFYGEIRLGFGDDQLDEGGRVEVQVQFRCSDTRSDTEAVALILGWWADRRPSGRVMIPRRFKSSNGSTASVALRRAIRLPRRVTITSVPSSTRCRYSLNRSWSSRTPTSSTDRCSVMEAT